MGEAASHHDFSTGCEDTWQTLNTASHHRFAPARGASAFIDREMVKPLDWKWYPGMDGSKIETSLDMSGAKRTDPREKLESQVVQNLDEHDDEMRIQAKALLESHGIPSNLPGIPPAKDGNQVWRCVPMDQVDLAGPEAAKQSGAALYSLEAKSDGKIGLKVPKKPPIFNPVSLKDAPRMNLKGLQHPFRQVLKDPSGSWYWVMTANGEPYRSQKHLLKIENGPVEQPSGGSTMMCHAGKQSWDVPVVAPGLFELEKRATTFLEVGPVELLN